MSNSLAEAYLLIVRESNVPIFGEAVPIPFTGQIELDAWSWEVKNKIYEANEAEKAKLKLKGGDDKKGAKPGDAKSGSAAKKPDSPPFKPDGLIRQVSEMQVKSGLDQKERDKKVQELIRKAVLGYADAAGGDGDDKDKDDGSEKEMSLKFEKGADLATTPLLFALARGDVIPKAILTLFHRSKNAPVTLAITMSDVRITKYEVSCDPDDKMADIKEKWEATYHNVSWMYQNRPAASGPNFLTQGTVRVFEMDNPLPF